MGKLVIIRHYAPDIECQLAALEYLLRHAPRGEDTLVSDGPSGAARRADGQRVPEAKSADSIIPAEVADAVGQGNEAE